MAARLTAREVAERAGCSEALVDRLARLEIVPPGDDGRFEPADAHLVRLMAAFEESGISLEDVARGFASGDLTYSGMGSYFTEPAPFVATYGELAAAIGRPFELVARLVAAFGLAQPQPGDRVRADEAALVERFLTAWEVADDEELLRFARVRGDAMRRLAESGIRFYDTVVNRRLLERDDAPRAELWRQADGSASRRRPSPRSSSRGSTTATSSASSSASRPTRPRRISTVSASRPRATGGRPRSRSST